MKICIIGCGFVGLATGVTLATLGHRIRFVENDPLRLSSIKKGIAPFQEPDLSKLLSRGLRTDVISATSNYKDAVRNSEYIVVAVQTPAMKSGATNLKYIEASIREIAEVLTKGKTIIIKSTIPPGTTDNFVLPILEKTSGLKSGRDFGLAISPEFLQEGKAVENSLHPDRIIVGSNNKKIAVDVLMLFEKINAPKITTTTVTAEMIKYASNSFLALKISFANEIANICEKFDTDVSDVMEGVGLDPRIGNKFLRAGLGFGGSCLPKDLAALISTAEAAGYKPDLLRAVQKNNNKQPMRAIDLLEEELGDLKAKRIAILGLAFKVGVDDVRDSRAFPIAINLLAKGAKVIGYDSLASSSFIKILPEISYAASAREALIDTDGCIVQTEDPEFSKLGKNDFDLMRTKVVIDGRRFLSPKKLKKFGVRLRAVGLGRN